MRKRTPTTMRTAPTTRPPRVAIGRVARRRGGAAPRHGTVDPSGARHAAGRARRAGARALGARGPCPGGRSGTTMAITM